MRLLFLFIICIHFCNGINRIKEKSTQLIELKVIQGSDFEYRKIYGIKYYLSAFYGSREDILDLLSVRNKQINHLEIQKEFIGDENKNLLYVELITSKNIENEVRNHFFQNGNQIINNYKLYSEKLFLINNRTIEYQNEEFKEPPLLFGKGFIPLSRRIYKSDPLYSYIFLLPVESFNTMKMQFGQNNQIEFLSID